MDNKQARLFEEAMEALKDYGIEMGSDEIQTVHTLLLVQILATLEEIQKSIKQISPFSEHSPHQ